MSSDTTGAVRKGEKLQDRVEQELQSSNNDAEGYRDSRENVQLAIDFAHHAEALGFERTSEVDEKGQPFESSAAIEAKFITPQDPIVLTADGSRLPAIPVDEAIKLNKLRDELNGRDPGARSPVPEAIRLSKDGTIHGRANHDVSALTLASEETNTSLHDAVPPSRTNPLFPALPVYGPPTLLRTCQFWFFRVSSFFGSLGFLLVVLLGALFTAIPAALERSWMMMKDQDPAKRRPFYAEEEIRESLRVQAAEKWSRRETEAIPRVSMNDDYSEAEVDSSDEYRPTEGGEDPLICDVGYYARRVGLDIEEYKVQTEDGFVIDLWHVYDPHEYVPAPPERRAKKSPECFSDGFLADGRRNGTVATQYRDGSRRYPVLLIHGLLQSGGAYCCNDDESLAFYLCKQGYDVWLGNNRAGFNPEHVRLRYEDPRMWAWNIRQMGVMDLPALTSRVLSETGFEKLGLIAHSQGTTQTLVALAREQRPDIGQRISVFCGLAPAAYSGPLIKKGYFKFMSILTPALFKIVFGIHAFIPFMMLAQKTVPGPMYGDLGYLIFSFLFDWTDVRWDRRLRRRFFQFAPVYVSAESMRWWLGRDCFAKQKCILSTREEGQVEDEEDEEEEAYFTQHPGTTSEDLNCQKVEHSHREHGKYAWYDKHAPPMAFWVGGNDHLVDGKRLLRRFERGREPHVDIVHKKIIENYEHLDVVWAIDVIDKVGKELKEVIWQTVSWEARKLCRMPKDCEHVQPWKSSRGASSSAEQDTVTEHAAQGEDEKGRKAQRREEEEELPSP
jgi:pimeloyl-ACP methyl ester carboxylesterase